VEYSGDRFSDYEHRAYGLLRATDRRSHPLSIGLCGLFVPVQVIPPALQLD
jgi:hypothetical protein